MRISLEEELMYRVMESIYDSGVPVSFKGSMVLRAFLMESGYTDDTRHTVDIDANWNTDTSPTTEQMADSFQKAMDSNGLSYTVKPYRTYAEGRSAGFEVTSNDSGDVLFTMDVDVNKPAVSTRIYQVSDIRFKGISPSHMIADKLTVVSSDSVFRRIKDVVDLYYMSKVFTFDREDILKALHTSGKVLGEFKCFIDRKEELKHAYDKFRFAGNVNKPSFDEVYQAVTAYIVSLLPQNI